MSLSQHKPDPTPAQEVRFATSVEGFPVAQFGDTAFAMLPGRDDKHFLGHAWRPRRPLQELVRKDFYGHGDVLADQEAFCAKVREQAGHAREKRALGRREIRSRINTSTEPYTGLANLPDPLFQTGQPGAAGFVVIGRGVDLQPLAGPSDRYPPIYQYPVDQLALPGRP